MLLAFVVACAAYLAVDFLEFLQLGKDCARYFGQSGIFVVERLNFWEAALYVRDMFVFVIYEKERRLGVAFLEFAQKGVL